MEQKCQNQIKNNYDRISTTSRSQVKNENTVQFFKSFTKHFKYIFHKHISTRVTLNRCV